MGMTATKRSYIASNLKNHWPEPREIERFFLPPPHNEWFRHTSNDSGGFSAEGVNGTEHFAIKDDRRIDIEFQIWIRPEHGVMLIWSKWGGGFEEMFTSKGDMSRLREYITTAHGDDMPLAFFIPFEDAWKAVKEFLETDGKLPKSIEWVENSTLPRDTFPPP
jgi:hypothetical protein